MDMEPEPSSSNHDKQEGEPTRRPRRPNYRRNYKNGPRRRPENYNHITSPPEPLDLSNGARDSANYVEVTQTSISHTENLDINDGSRPICSNPDSTFAPRNDPARYRNHSMHSNRRVRGGRRYIDSSQENNFQQARHNQPFQTNSRGHSSGRSRGRASNVRSLGQTRSNAPVQDEPVIEEQPTTSKFTENLGNSCSGGAARSSSDIQSEIAEHQLRSNTFECMICCDNINRFKPIWCCSNCYNIFHLKCAIEWCNKSIKSRNDTIANAQYPSLSLAIDNQAVQVVGPSSTSRQGYNHYQSERINSVEWPCPACREVLYERPDKYKCFCGKVVRPEVNKLLTPHSCGQLCGRKRPNLDCPHSCNSICHPGRCAPCALSSRLPCYCGKLTKEVKCAIGTSSCGQICNKSLTCGIHNCSRTCHNGSCGDCSETLTITCQCGDLKIRKSCMESIKAGKKNKNLTCDKICGKLLDCGLHNCNERCHPGPNCSSCKLLSQNIKTCPCGSTQIKKSLLAERKSCTDPVPTCENKCNRPLICGPEKNHHRCQKKCHTGPCPPCKLKMTTQCECKLSTKTIACSLMYEKVVEEANQVHFKQVKYNFSCDTKCNKLKNCGRHRCYNKCCKFLSASETSVHKCDQICSKKLPCGLHNCPETCHPGQCGDCTNIGWEELTCHCGSSVLYPPIPCNARPPACHRPCRRPHNCGHPVKHECHDDSENCAPCTVFVKKTCFCGSESKDSVHCYLTGYSCGKTCRKQLNCKNHTCTRVCHDNECETPNNRGVILCKQPCQTTRYFCKHICGIPCHGKSPCPTTDCKKIIEISCECGNKKERIECFKAMKDVDNRNKVAMIMTNRANQDESIMIDLSKKPAHKSGPESSKNNLKKLDCDDTCSILKRNKALAEALDIAQPDLKPVSIFGEDPLRLLRQATTQDYKFVSATYGTLVRLIKSAKESDKRFVFMQFPPAEKLRREVVHELAYHFNCTSESRDEEPFRHVVVRAHKNKSSVPDFSIEQLLPVSD